MVVLDHGFFSSIDCGPRMGAIFLAAFLGQAVVVASMAVRGRRANERYPIEMIDEQPFFTRRRFVTAALWCVVFMVVAGVCACLRTTTAIFLDSRSLVETSCTGPSSGEYRLDRTTSSVIFRHEHEWLSKRSSESTYLEVTAPDAPRPIYIDLNRNIPSKDLTDFAPGAMAAYSSFRASGGYH